MWNGHLLDLDAYLERVGHRLVPGAERIGTLRALHRAHLAAFPFENADIALGRPVPLDVGSLQDKMVRGRRGGYCYEQNLLFAAVLDRLGHRVTGLAARVLALRRGGDVPRLHAVLLVDGEWLVDVGFGCGGLLEPLRLAPGRPVAQGDWTFRLDRTDVWTLRSLQGDGWAPLYDFTEDPRTPADYAVFHHYLSTHPKSVFTGRLVVQRTDDHARYALTDREFTVTTADGTTRRRTLADGELSATLREVFGLEPPVEDDRWWRDA